MSSRQSRWVAIFAAAFLPWQDLTASLPHFTDKQSQITLATGIAGVIGAHQFDPAMQEAWANQNRLHGAEWLGNEILGTGVPGALLGGGAWLLGAHREDDKLTAFGQTEIEALLAAAAATEVLKISVARERPDASDHRSFPSGHTSTIFVASQVVEEFYGWKFGSLGYAAGVYTALSRISSNRHWLSDTVAGATLGVWIGHALSEGRLERLPKPRAVRVRPWMLDGGGGVLVSGEW